MNPTTLTLGELRLELTLISRSGERLNQPYSDWLTCDVALTLPAFSGQVRWAVRPSELEELARKLSTMHAAFPAHPQVVFKPTEPNVVLIFEAVRTGQIVVQFAFRPDLGEDIVLQGSVGMDQSYLPHIARAIRSFLKFSASRYKRS